MTDAQYIEARAAIVNPSEPSPEEIAEIQEIYAQEMWDVTVAEAVDADVAENDDEEVEVQQSHNDNGK